MNWTMDNEETLSRTANMLGDAKEVRHSIECIRDVSRLIAKHTTHEDARFEALALAWYVDQHMLVKHLDEVVRRLELMYEMLERDD